MITYLLYMMVGILIGLLISYEKQLKDKKHKLECEEKTNREVIYDANIKQYDELLDSMRLLNKGIKEAQKKKEGVARR